MNLFEAIEAHSQTNQVEPVSKLNQYIEACKARPGITGIRLDTVHVAMLLSCRNVNDMLSQADYERFHDLLTRAVTALKAKYAVSATNAVICKCVVKPF